MRTSLKTILTIESHKNSDMSEKKTQKPKRARNVTLKPYVRKCGAYNKLWPRDEVILARICEIKANTPANDKAKHKELKDQIYGM